MEKKTHNLLVKVTPDLYSRLEQHLALAHRDPGPRLTKGAVIRQALSELLDREDAYRLEQAELLDGEQG